MRRRLIATALSSVMLTAGLLGSAGVAAGATTDHAGPRAAGAVRLDGRQEVQGGDPDGRGSFAYIVVEDTLCYLLTAHRIAPAAAAHIHDGDRGVEGGIVVGLTAPTRGVSFGCIAAQPDTTPGGPTVLTQSELDAIVAEPAGFYANVHNADFQAGAIRGQLR
jgi:hypothetical protein